MKLRAKHPARKATLSWFTIKTLRSTTSHLRSWRIDLACIRREIFRVNKLIASLLAAGAALILAGCVIPAWPMKATPGASGRVVDSVTQGAVDPAGPLYPRPGTPPIREKSLARGSWDDK